MGVRVAELVSTTFRAMGTDVDVFVLDGVDADLQWAAEEVWRGEERWSRFLADSDVSRLTVASGEWVTVAPETIDLLHATVQASASSGGAFDPLLGECLAALGYDRSFDAVSVERAGVASPSRTVIPAPGEIEIDDERRRARIPAGTALDLGGIAKGWTADTVAAGLVARGARGACANLGGDLAVAGAAPDPAGWVVDVEQTTGEGPIGLLAVHAGGVATSTIRKRAWLGPAGDQRHHLIDPGTGTPCDGDLVDVTVVAPSATAAEVLTKVAFAAPGLLDSALRSASAAALLTTRSGAVLERGDPRVLHDVIVGRADVR